MQRSPCRGAGTASDRLQITHGQAGQTQLTQTINTAYSLQDVMLALHFKLVDCCRQGAVAHLGRFIGHLDSILQDVDGELGGRVGGDPQPEVFRGSCWVYLLTHLVQHWHPAGGKVTVLHKQVICHPDKSVYICICTDIYCMAHICKVGHACFFGQLCNWQKALTKVQLRNGHSSDYVLSYL